MLGVELLGIGVALPVALGVGLVAHELAHAAVLHLLGIPYDISWFPGDTGGFLDVGLVGAWATVTPRRIPSHVAPWGLRLSALAPLALAGPFVLVPAGVVPDPLTLNGAAVVATVAWLGCALPSPQDFSLFWHAEQVLEERSASGKGAS